MSKEPLNIKQLKALENKLLTVFIRSDRLFDQHHSKLTAMIQAGREVNIDEIKSLQDAYNNNEDYRSPIRSKIEEKLNKVLYHLQSTEQVSIPLQKKSS